MKILTAMYTMKRGGAYDRFRLMLEAFLERGCHVYCLSLTPITMEWPSFHNHVVRTPLRMREGLIAQLWVFFSFPFYSLFLGWQQKIRIFIAFGSIYAFIFTLSKCVLNKPMITFIRGDLAFGLKTRGTIGLFLWLARKIEYLGLRFSDRILAVNKATQERVIQTLGRKRKIDVRTLFNHIPAMDRFLLEDGLQMKRRYGIPENGRVLVTAGILNRGKNIEMLIKGFSRIEVANLFLVVAGEGSTEQDFCYRDLLIELVGNLGLDHRVIFTGWLEKIELWRLFAAADLFLLPSLREGMPNVLLEALGCDISCMGSDIPGIRDILKHSDLMFDPFDERSFAEKAIRYFSDPQFSERIRSLCRERKKEFDFDWKERTFQIVTAGFNESVTDG
jgi:glycosyltransferase involved in cell wall biosynthesis